MSAYLKKEIEKTQQTSREVIVSVESSETMLEDFKYEQKNCSESICTQSDVSLDMRFKGSEESAIVSTSTITSPLHHSKPSNVDLNQQRPSEFYTA